MNSGRQTVAHERNHTMIVAQGSYLLRYVSADTADAAPIVRVKAAPKDSRGISLVPVTSNAGKGLRTPGDYVLVHAKRAGAIELTVSSSRPKGSVEAEVRLERIVPATPRSAARSVSFPSEVDESRGVQALDQPIEIVAHVSHRGDVVAHHDEWICGPDCPMPIEGIEIRWPNKPANVDLSYSVVAGPRKRQRSSEKLAGQFAGTRGKALPLVGIRLRLTGAQASNYKLTAQALFLGSQVSSSSGLELALSGSTGREPLVGFRLSVVAQRSALRERSALSPNGVVSARSSVGMKQVGQVRVYRPARVPAS